MVIIATLAAVAQTNSNQEAVPANPQTLVDYLRLGRRQYQAQEYESALEAYEKARDLAPTNSTINYYVGSCRYMLKDYRRATESFAAYVTVTPTNGRAFYYLGCSQIHLGQIEEAENSFRKSIMLRPESADAYGQLAFCLDRQGRKKDTLEACAQALKLNPRYSYAHLLSGKSYYSLRAFAEAVAEMEKYVQAQPDDFDGFWYLGHSHFMLKHFDAAAGAFEKALQLRSSEQQIRRELFLCYLATGQYGKAGNIYPILFKAGSAALMVGYCLTLAILLTVSIRVQARTAPGLWFAIMWLSGFMGGQLVFGFALPVFTPVQGTEAVLAGMGLAALPLFVAAYFGFRQQPWGGPFNWPRPFVSWRLLVVAVLGVVFINAFEAGYTKVVERLTHQTFPSQMALPFVREVLQDRPLVAIFAVALAAPVAEEILFRGLLFGALGQRFSGLWTIILSSALFAIIHLQAVYFLPIFCVGALCGWLRYRSGSLLPPVLLHVTNNGFALVALYFFPNG